VNAAALQGPLAKRPQATPLHSAKVDRGRACAAGAHLARRPHTTTASPLKVAVAGLGFGEKVHLPALRPPAGTRTGGPLHAAHRRALESRLAAAPVTGFSDFERPARRSRTRLLVIATHRRRALSWPAAALERRASTCWLGKAGSACEASRCLNCNGWPSARTERGWSDFEYRGRYRWCQRSKPAQSGSIAIRLAGEP